MTSAALIVGNVVTLALLAHRGADDIFAPYNLVRRLAVGLQPALCLGMNIGLVRFLPGRASDYRAGLSRRALQYFGLALIIATVLAALARPLVASSMPLLTSASTYWAAWLNIVATAVVAMTYALFRAEMRQRRANVLNLLSVTIVPLLVIVLAPRGWAISALLAWAGGGTLVAALAVSLRHLLWLWRAETDAHSSVSWNREGASLVGFSVARVPAAVSIGLMTVVGPWIAASGATVREASYLLAGFAFAQGLSTALGALGLVLMPRVAGYAAGGLDDRSTLLIEKGLYVALLVAAVATPLLIAEAGPLVRWWLGSDLAAGVRAVQVVLLSVPGVLAYSLLGPVSDASSDRPVTTLAAGLGLLLCVAGSLLWRSVPVGLAAAFSAGSTASAFILTSSVLRRFRVTLHAWNLTMWVTTSAVACLIILGYGRLVSWSPFVEVSVAAFTGIALVTLGIYFSPKGMRLWDSIADLGGRVRGRP